MTTIHVHGILAYEYGEVFTAKLRSPKDCWDAIDVNNEGFINRMLSLAKNGVFYGMIIDGEESEYNRMISKEQPEEVHLVPMIMGSGPVIAPVAAAIGSLVASVGAVAGAAFSAIGTAGLLGQFALTAASLFISSLLQPSPKLPQPKAPVAGAKDSFLFSNKVNVARQGVPVPLGYGRLRIGSAVIQSTIKSFPQNKDLLSSFATAARGGSEDYYVVTDSRENALALANNSVPDFGFDVIGELRRRGGFAAVSSNEEGAINRFVTEGINVGWWNKIKHLYVFTWNNSGMSAVDWKNVDSSTETFGSQVYHNEGFISGDGWVGNNDNFNTSYDLSGLFTEGIEYNDCSLAYAVSGEEQSAPSGRILMGTYEAAQTGYLSLGYNIASNEIIATAGGTTTFDHPVNTQQGVAVFSRSGSNASILQAAGGILTGINGTMSETATFQNKTGDVLALGYGGFSQAAGGYNSQNDAAAFAVGLALTPAEHTGFAISLRLLCNELGAGIR